MKRGSSTDRYFRASACGLCLVLFALASIATARAEKQKSVAPTRRTPPVRIQPMQLPRPATSSAVSFEQAVTELANTQLPGNQRLEVAKIGQLAWATQGARVPSTVVTPGVAQTAGAALMQVYFVLPEGLFTYEPTGHILQPISEGDVRAAMAASLLKQAIAPAGGCQIIVAGSVRDFSARYGTRARTVMALQAGKMSQNIQLQAVAQGLTFVSVDAVEGADVRRVARIPRNYEPLYVAIVGYPASQTAETAAQPVAPQPGRRALLVVPPMGFQDEELLATRRALEAAGVQVTVASGRKGPLGGMFGGTAQADVLLNQASVDSYDAVVFIGGTGAIEYVNNPIAQNLARQASVQHKVLAAIGTAPGILANAGVMRGVRSTGYLSERDRLTQAGAVYTGNPAEKDGLIITAVGSPAAALFAQAILEGLGEMKQ